MPGPGPFQGLRRASSSVSRPTKRVSPRAAAACKRAPHRAGPDQLKDLHRRRQPLDRHRPQRRDLHKALDQPQRRGVSRIEPGMASCSMRAARCVVCPTAV